MAPLQPPFPTDPISLPTDADGQIAVAESNGHLAEPSISTAVESSPGVERPKITGEMIDARIEKLLSQVHANRPSEVVSLIRKAWEFCVRHHAGQERASGEPYIIHPLEV